MVANAGLAVVALRLSITYTIGQLRTPTTVLQCNLNDSIYLMMLTFSSLGTSGSSCFFNFFKLSHWISKFANVFQFMLAGVRGLPTWV